MRNDYDLILGAKAKNSDDISALYHQYIPLTYRHAHRLNMLTDDQKSDYAQDAFLRCLKAIEYVKIEKIDRPDTWKFYQVYDWFLQNLDKKYRKVVFHDNRSISFSHYYNDGNDLEFKEAPECRVGYEDTNMTKFEREEAGDLFLKKLSPLQRDVLKRRQNNQTIASIAKDLKVSYGTIHGSIYYAKKLAETIIL